ncbi:helix-turn-helix domain-containing protein [Leifsonia poae]|uniref:helix-turn-helix domain-containing protein n=1 Tax=Leifsonia poae TaxID=110933 RepID=UPI001CC0E7C7|nr:helix-turn-helix domain-containing protein [Leifsonia poae]
MTAPFPATSAAPRSKGLLTPGVGPVEIARLWPGEAMRTLVRHYWLPRWSLPAGVTVRQQVLEYPASNLVVEAGDAALHRAKRGRSDTVLTGTGWAFGVLFHPGSARALVGASLRTAPPAVPIDRLEPGGLDGAIRRIRVAMSAGDDRGAVAAFERWAAVDLSPPGADAVLVNAIVEAVENDRELVRVEQLADRFGLGVRHLQRLVAGHIGFGPKWLIQRYRLQEAAAALRSGNAPPLAGLAAELGYVDQAHFGHEFKTVIGSTPGAYLAQAAASG